MKKKQALLLIFIVGILMIGIYLWRSNNSYHLESPQGKKLPDPSSPTSITPINESETRQQREDYEIISQKGPERELPPSTPLHPDPRESPHVSGYNESRQVPYSRLG